jgi:MoxR-like ATPase
MAREVDLFNQRFDALSGEVCRAIVGMSDVVEGTLSAIFAGGHVLLEGVPGLGKTLLVKSVARAFGLSFKRIQFTPDLMPSDITGTQVLTEDENGARKFVFKPGPIFAQIVLADEINRATPKTQSALLEAMEERQITVLDQTYRLIQPFFVLATQNPVELEGTYPLPEAQLDRFLIKLLVNPPSPEELKEVLRRTTGVAVPETRPVFDPKEVAAIVEQMRRLVRSVFVPDALQDAVVRMMGALTPSSQFATKKVQQYVRFGPGPRGAQSVILLAKVFALRDGRMNLALEDIRRALVLACRHRMILNFQAEADSVSADIIVGEVQNAR